MTYDRILITGASGFIGSRLCEKFKLQYGLLYRALVHNYNKAARIARLGSDMVAADLRDPAQLETALSGCDAVVHLAYVERKNVEAGLLAACRRAGIKRFVHISSMAVHGPHPGPECAHEETAVIGKYNEPYSDAKARSENTVRQEFSRGLAGVILRPTIVYGPYGPFVINVINRAREGVITLIDDGAGICNAVHVDDVCDAVYAALHSDKALGKAFFINGDRAVTWREYNLTFAHMVSPQVEVRSVAAGDIRQYWAARAPSLRTNFRAFKRLLASPEFQSQLENVPALRTSIRWSKARLKKLLSSNQLIALQNAGAVAPAPAGAATWPNIGRLVREDFHLEFSNALAKELMGWKPAFDFPAGAEAARSWLAFAGMLGPRAE